MLVLRRIYSKILQYTSVPLFVLLYLSYLSGYGITRSSVVESLTLGLLDYGICAKLHSSPLHYVTGSLAFLHGISGFMVMIGRSRRIRRKKSAEKILWIILIIVLIQLMLLEFR